MYLYRQCEGLLLRYLELFPCVALTGPRQSGKSTLVRHLLPDRPYVTLDDPDEELAVTNDPVGFLGRFPDRVIIDEVQRAPALFRYLKLSIDAEPERMGRFVLTGSNQFMLQRNLSESLAGRIGLLSLLPFEHRELPPPLRSRQLLEGSYPALAVREFTGLREWYAAYVATYLERDVRLVNDIGKLADFHRLLRLLAARTSQEQNMSSLSREIGVSSHTIDAWVSVLESSYLTFNVQPFHANLGKRLIKRPKLYFWDTGLVCHLTGIRDREALEDGPLLGALLENLVVAETRKKILHAGLDQDLFFYRDNVGREVDLIIHDRGARLVRLIEIKSGHTAKHEWISRLEEIAAILDPYLKAEGLKVGCQVVYRGATRRSWPKAGFDYLNVEDFLREE